MRFATLGLFILTWLTWQRQGHRPVAGACTIYRTPAGVIYDVCAP